MIIQRRNGRIIHGQGLQRAWAPHRDPSCLCAFDADPGYYVKNGTGVSRWNDISGHGNHALQPTALNQPTWIESDPDFRGHGSLLFDGSLSHFVVNPCPIPALFTWVAVVKWGIKNSNTILDHYNSPSNRQAIYLNAASLPAGYAGGAAITGTSCPANQMSVVAFVAGGTASALYINLLSPVATGATGATTMPGFCIGANATQYNMMLGKIAALYGFVGAANSSKIARLLRCLGSKYGISIA